MAGGAYVALALFCGLSSGVIGRIKGSSFLIWFLIGLVLPLLGTLAALLYRREQDVPRANCPECGKRIALHDQVCTRCGRDLEWRFGEAPELPAS
jgi:DNA-directed RNA polymerase subunit RPC12/RpoP